MDSQTAPAGLFVDSEEGPISMVAFTDVTGDLGVSVELSRYYQSGQ